VSSPRFWFLLRGWFFFSSLAVALLTRDGVLCRYAGSIHSTEAYDGNSELLYCMKGAPERIVSRCGFVMKNGEAMPLTDEERSSIDKGNASLMRAGERVLGFAMRRLPRGQFEKDGCKVLDADGKDTGTRAWGDADSTKCENADSNGTNWGKPVTQQARDKKGVLKVDDDGQPVMEGVPFPYNGLPAMPEEGEPRELVFLGLIALIDPPRQAVPKAVKDCMAGGIQVTDSSRSCVCVACSSCGVGYVLTPNDLCPPLV
jgi:magnesium-transporting ATPase (P-type)